MRAILHATTAAVILTTASLQTAPASAVVIGGTFSGVVDVAGSFGAGVLPSGVAVGTAMSGTLSYDTDTISADLDPSPSVARHADPVNTLLSFEIAGHTFTAVGNSVILQDTGSVQAFALQDFGGTTVTVPNPVGNAFMAFTLLDQSVPLELIGGLSLPTAVPPFDFGAATLAQFQVTATNGPDGYEILGRITGVAFDVPEPATLALFGIGLVALGLGRQRRSYSPR